MSKYDDITNRIESLNKLLQVDEIGEDYITIIFNDYSLNGALLWEIEEILNDYNNILLNYINTETGQYSEENYILLSFYGEFGKDESSPEEIERQREGDKQDQDFDSWREQKRGL